MTGTAREEPIERGKACIRCRRRKIKCDGRRPFCSACIRTDRKDDCEYSDTQGRTRTEILEETLERLQARLLELENPDAVRPVLLADPYRPDEQPLSPTGQQAEDTINWWEEETPPAQIRDTLLELFIPRAPLLGYTLSSGRLIAALALPESDFFRLPRCLINVIVLWSLRISGIPELLDLEDIFIEKSTLSLQRQAWLGNPAISENAKSQFRIYAIQASVLLAQYFFVINRNIEARYYANSAATLALSAGLHRVLSASAVPSQGIADSEEFALAPVLSAAELGDRIRVFWAVFFLDRCWNVSIGLPSILVDDATRGTQIDTPWPLESHTYDQVSIVDILPSSRTVQNYLSEEASGSVVISGESMLALRVKAVTLYERASRISYEARRGQPFVDALIQALARAIANLAARLPPLDRSNTANSVDRQMLAVAHGLVHAACIQLHSVDGFVSASCHRSKPSQQHANEILAILNIVIDETEDTKGGMRVYDPVFGIIASTGMKPLVHEYNILVGGSQDQASLIQKTLIRELIDSTLKKLRYAAGPSDLYPWFMQQAESIEEMIEG